MLHWRGQRIAVLQLTAAVRLRVGLPACKIAGDTFGRLVWRVAAAEPNLAAVRASSMVVRGLSAGGSPKRLGRARKLITDPAEQAPIAETAAMRERGESLIAISGAARAGIADLAPIDEKHPPMARPTARSGGIEPCCVPTL